VRIFASVGRAGWDLPCVGRSEARPANDVPHRLSLARIGRPEQPGLDLAVLELPFNKVRLPDG
jgi:hypothetical protein